MNATTTTLPLTDRLLRQHERWTRLAWPLAIVAAGLAATLGINWRRHPFLARVEHWGTLPLWWAAGVALTFLAAGVVSLQRRRAGLGSARRLDRRLDAKNRLETAAILRGDAGAIARAQREEAADFLMRQSVAPPRRGPLLVLGALAALLLLAHLATLLTWTRPWISLAAAHPVPKPPPATPPPAHIQWKTPASEIKASPIEEVPLQALATSAGGLRDMVLEMSVNGQPRLSVPVPADALQAAGSHPVQASIYLDQLEVEPFDVVSYYLRARRIATRPLPETTSSVQFVEIKPFRDDVREVVGKEGNAGFALITALKVAQLRLIKENFVLAHTDLDPQSAEWKKENGRVGGQQAALEKKTGEALQQLIEDGAPADVIDLLTQAKPFMGDAAQKIAAAANQPALTPQGKALGLITAVEKMARKFAAHGGAMHGQKPNVNDPFADKQQFEMKQRFKTAGGQLEMLAAAQAKLAEDLANPDPSATSSPTLAPDANQPPDPDKIEGTLAERQTQISQRVGALLTGRIFNPEITGHLEQGHDQARESLRRIDGGDTPAAREPAAAAARELQLAADAMNRVGEEQAKLQLADAQHTLNEAADQARDAARQNSDEAARQRAEQAAEAARQAARDLAAQAQAEQDTGSSEAAKRLNDMARALSAPDLRNALEKLRAQPRSPERAQAAADRLQQMAELAARQRSTGPLSPEELARLVERLERDRVNMQRLALNDPGAKANDPTANALPDQGPRHDGNEPAGQEKPADPQQANAPGQSSPGGNQPGDPKPDQPGGSKPGQEGKPGEGKQGQGQQGQGQPGREPGKYGQGPGQKGQGQPGQSPSQQGQGQAKAGQGQGQGQGQPGQGKGQGDGSGQGSGQQTARNGSGTGQSGASPQGRGGSSSSPGGGTGQASGSRGHDDTDLGDTLHRSVGEMQSGPISAGDEPSVKPTYTDHAPADVRTRDPRETREQFARELVEDVREAAQDAVVVVPKSDALADVRATLRDVPLELHYRDEAALFSRIDPPLQGLIDSLHAAQQHARRDHSLTDGNLDLAPPAYRPAVADYFEQLSRDYDGAPPATPAPNNE